MVLQNSNRMWAQGFVSAGALLWACGAAAGQVAADFEPPVYSGSAAGTLLTNGFGMGGQDGWYNPVSGSNETHIFTYAGNPYAIPQNPQGGTQLQVGVHGGNLAFGRAQRNIDFSAGGVWVAQWDVLVNYVGLELTAADNIGSFSLQPSGTTRYWQQILQWPAATTPTPVTTFRINYGVFTTAPYNQATPPFISPGPQWDGLLVNNWYRQTTTWNFDSAQILEVSIQDLTGGGPVTTVDVSGLGWYLFGGPNSTSPLPQAFRLFTGGGGGTTPGGNMTAWDNISIGPVGASCYANCDGSTVEPVLNVDDFTCFINAYAVAQALPHAQQLTDYSNCDGSTIAPVLNVDDFTCFINSYAIGCP
jgi:hypothetical protein